MPGSEAALALLNRYRGEIAQFQAKARQSRQISGQPSLSMHQILPDGGMLRYSYNSGQETIYIRVRPRTVTVTTSTTPTTKQPQSPVLAVDVLFTPHKFLVGEIYRKEVSSVDYPATPPQTTTQLVGSTETLSYPPSDEGRGDADYTEKFVTLYVPGAQGNVVGGGYSSIAAAEAAMNADLYNDYNTELAQKYPGYGGTFTIQISGSTYYPFFGAPYYYAQFRTISMVPTQGVETITIPGTPAYTEETEVVFLEERNYLDMLPVVALRVVGTEPYEALSTEPAEDRRLQGLLTGKQAITRQIALEDAAGGARFYGAGFVAMPRFPLKAGIPPDDVNIEVWVGSANIRQYNEMPGEVGSAFGVDDSSMSYEAEDSVRCMVRAREFADGAYEVVQVTTQGQGRIEKFEAPDGGTPTVSVSVEMLDDARVLDWAFAAAPGWTDSGLEPADPLALTGKGTPGMGKLLDETPDITQPVAAAIVPPRTVPQEPVHAGPAQALTRIATIRWSPSTDGMSPGTAKIDLAGNIALV